MQGSKTSSTGSAVFKAPTGNSSGNGAADAFSLGDGEAIHAFNYKVCKQYATVINSGSGGWLKVACCRSPHKGSHITSNNVYGACTHFMLPAPSSHPLSNPLHVLLLTSLVVPPPSSPLRQAKPAGGTLKQGLSAILASVMIKRQKLESALHPRNDAPEVDDVLVNSLANEVVEALRDAAASLGALEVDGTRTTVGALGSQVWSGGDRGGGGVAAHACCRFAEHICAPFCYTLVVHAFHNPVYQWCSGARSGCNAERHHTLSPYSVTMRC
jgi:hypothetical protein